MAMDLNSYKDFAENDYLFFIEDYERGRVANYMAAMAQSICERYIKHIIDKYEEPASETQAATKTELLRTHNLTRLLNHLEEMGYSLDREARLNIRAADGYYFTTRYPGSDSIEVTQRDIDECAVAVQTCRKETERIETQILNRYAVNVKTCAYSFLKPRR